LFGSRLLARGLIVCLRTSIGVRAILRKS